MVGPLGVDRILYGTETAAAARAIKHPFEDPVCCLPRVCKSSSVEMPQNRYGGVPVALKLSHGVCFGPWLRKPIAPEVLQVNKSTVAQKRLSGNVSVIHQADVPDVVKGFVGRINIDVDVLDAARARTAGGEFVHSDLDLNGLEIYRSPLRC